MIKNFFRKTILVKQWALLSSTFMQKLGRILELFWSKVQRSKKHLFWTLNPLWSGINFFLNPFGQFLDFIILDHLAKNWINPYSSYWVILLTNQPTDQLTNYVSNFTRPGQPVGGQEGWQSENHINYPIIYTNYARHKHLLHWKDAHYLTKEGFM